VRRRDLEHAKDAGRVVCHRSHRDGAFGHGRATCSAVVEGGDAVPVQETVELELPRLDGVPQTADEEHVGPFADLLGPDVEFAGADVLAHA
jgi:hypothetical protein